MRPMFLLPALLLLIGPLPAQERQQRRALETALEAIERSIEALMRVGMHGEALQLARVAGRLEVQLDGIEMHAHEREREREQPRERGNDRERAVAEQRLEVLRTATKALLEGEKRELAGRIEHAIHALELRLEGRRDREAQTVYERAPTNAEQAEILGVAADLWRSFKAPDRAEMVARLAAELAERAGRRRSVDREGVDREGVDREGADREGADREGADREREAARHQLELLHKAYHALDEAGRGNEGNIVERMIGAQTVRLEGRRDDKARAILEREPPLAHQAEVVLYSARLWAERGDEKLAAMLQEYGGKIATRAKRARQR